MQRPGYMGATLRLLRKSSSVWLTVREIARTLRITRKQAQTAIDNLRIKGCVEHRFSEVMECKEYRVTVREESGVFLLQIHWCRVIQESNDNESCEREVQCNCGEGDP